MRLLQWMARGWPLTVPAMLEFLRTLLNIEIRLSFCPQLFAKGSLTSTGTFSVKIDRLNFKANITYGLN